MQLASILEFVPAAISFVLAGVLVLTAIMVVIARLKRAMFGVRVKEENTGGLRGFLSNFD